jgi:anti-anti-sigma factor
MRNAPTREQSGRSNLLNSSLVAFPPCLCLSLRGELDLSSAGDLPQETFASRRDLTTVLVDLGDLTFCDASGLRALLACARRHRALGRSVVVVRATPIMWRLMRLCGVTDRLRSVRPVRAASSGDTGPGAPRAREGQPPVVELVSARSA